MKLPTLSFVNRDDKNIKFAKEKELKARKCQIKLPRSESKILI